MKSLLLILLVAFSANAAFAQDKRTDAERQIDLDRIKAMRTADAKRIADEARYPRVTPPIGLPPQSQN
jgi:hypothetical protein